MYHGTAGTDIAKVLFELQGYIKYLIALYYSHSEKHSIIHLVYVCMSIGMVIS